MTSKSQEARIYEEVQAHSQKGEFFIVFEGTLEQLAGQNGTFFDITKTFTTEMLQYPNVDSDSRERVGDPSMTDIHRIALTSQENTFGTDIMLNLVEPNKSVEDQIIVGDVHHPSLGGTEKDVDSPSVKALLLIKKGVSHSLEFPREIHVSSESTYTVNNHTLGMYALNTLDVERASGMHGSITTPDGTQGILVNHESLLHRLLNRNTQFSQQATTYQEKWVISITLFDEINKFWKENHVRLVTKIDLPSVVARLAPAGRTWDELLVKIRREKPRADLVLTTPGVIKVGLSIDYMIAGHYTPGTAETSGSANRPSYQANPNDFSSSETSGGSSSDDEVSFGSD